MYEKIISSGAKESKNPYGASDGYSSLKEYKLSIYEKIKEFSKDNKGKGDMVWVTIPDECFLAMRQDPAYESWVLGKIRAAYAACNDDGYDSWIFLKFGASEADFKQQTHTVPDSKTQKKMRDREQEIKKEIERQRKKRLEKKLLEEKWKKQKAERTYVQLKILDHRHQVEDENKAIRFDKDYTPKDHRASLYATAKRRAYAYESTFRYTDNSFTC